MKRETQEMILLIIVGGVVFTGWCLTFIIPPKTYQMEFTVWSAHFKNVTEPEWSVGTYGKGGFWLRGNVNITIEEERTYLMEFHWDSTASAVHERAIVHWIKEVPSS